MLIKTFGNNFNLISKKLLVIKFFLQNRKVPFRIGIYIVDSIANIF